MDLVNMTLHVNISFTNKT